MKFAALLIGASGVGLLATYNALLGAIVILLGMGVPAISVREISSLHTDSQPDRSVTAIVAVKRLCWLLGILGLMLTFVNGDNISRWIFGDVSHAQEITALSIVVLLNILANAYIAIIQGTRRVINLAKNNILGAFGGTLVTLFCFIALGIDGVIWALLGIALFQFIIAKYYARYAPLPVNVETWRESLRISGHLLKHGFPLMLSSFVATATSLIILAMITKDLNLTSAGLYSSAAALTGVFFGLLNSMGTDYYPRLSSVNQNPLSMSQIVNEQTEIGLLLTVPGLLMCWVLSPFLLELLYTQSFIPATPLLQWFLVGCFGRIVSWPMGFVLLTMGRSKIFLLVETAVQTIHILLVWFAVKSGSLLQTAIAFCLVYIVYAIFMFLLCRRLIGFGWSKIVRRLLLISIFQFLLVGVLMELFGDVYGLISALIVVIFSLFVSIKSVARILGFDHPIVMRIIRLPYVEKWIKSL